MAKIYCDKCGADTGYTDDTAIVDKPRSIIPDNCGEENRIHLCTVCWEKLDATNLLGRG
tara:strand:- start:196 stop:372 length:177 start_codon:yes stop_codon:yes gene_type:complete